MYYCRFLFDLQVLLSLPLFQQLGLRGVERVTRLAREQQNVSGLKLFEKSEIQRCKGTRSRKVSPAHTNDDLSAYHAVSR